MDLGKIKILYPQNIQSPTAMSVNYTFLLFDPFPFVGFYN